MPSALRCPTKIPEIIPHAMEPAIVVFDNGEIEVQCYKCEYYLGEDEGRRGLLLGAYRPPNKEINVLTGTPIARDRITGRFKSVIRQDCIVCGRTEPNHDEHCTQGKKKEKEG